MALWEVIVGAIISASFLVGYLIYHFSKEEIEPFRSKLLTSISPGAAMFIGLFLLPLLRHYQELVLVLLAVGITLGILTADLKQSLRNSVISIISFLIFYLYYLRG